MNYYAARELMDKDGKGTGRFHYTCQNDNDIWPVGYCNSPEACPDCHGRSWMFTEQPACERCNNKGYLKKENPCLGHDTKEGAEQHYREYLIDSARYDGNNDNQQNKCKVCGEWTQKYAIVKGMDVIDLCEVHCNKENLEKVYPKIGWIASS